eukprot:CAMPEP_0185379876 /NCGR_PEP_ID=MMETSP1364-20130426/48775_1 /TAXON_ID=38817 /ORGANISM="Gephyrocapsa oceanica, Strain RCC1303" /LENGTH=86 /DNA_ID=CAMNT_0027981477 /DNA_START=61 /DNA_END=318 /DNA_ORIENTATION=-
MLDFASHAPGPSLAPRPRSPLGPSKVPNHAAQARVPSKQSGERAIPGPGRAGGSGRGWLAAGRGGKAVPSRQLERRGASARCGLAA